MMLLAGCSDDIITPPGPLPDEERPRDVFLCFRLKLSDDGIPGMSRGGSRALTDEQTPGTDMENAVRTMGLFIYDAGNNTLVDYVYLEGDEIAKITSESGLVVPVYGTPGKSIYVYTVVNPTAKICELFSSMTGIDDLSVHSGKTDYWDVMDEFVPGTGGHQTALEGNGTSGIPMTGVFKENGHSDNLITITGDITEDNPLAVTAEVSRIVAKAHVLAKATKEYTLSDGTRMQYVFAEDKSSHVREADNSEFANWIGWIRLSDVRYIPNGMNKSTYIFPHMDKDGRLADLNMNLMDYAIDERFNRSEYDKDFVYYYGVDLHRVNVSSTSHMAQVEAFDQTKLDNTKGTDNPNRYTKGMYCLENYFSIPSSTDYNAVLSTYINNGLAIPVVTHITVTAQLTPRNIVVAKDYADIMDEFIKEYKQDPSKFYRIYGLTPADFNDADVVRWENTLKNRYFGATLPDIYRDDFRIIRTQSEADAMALIDWSLMANLLWSGNDSDFEKGKYPAATFYVYDTNYDPDGTDETMWTQRYLYLTAGAVNKDNLTDSNIRIKTYSVPHIGGWGYYFTYLDQMKTSDKVIPYTSSQVTRNTYYLITINNFGGPGGTITRPEYIKVNTVPVNWTYGGRGDVPLH